MKKFLHILLIMLPVFLILSCEEGGNMKVESVFKNEERIPEKYTCAGMNINPPITVTGIPQGAKSIVIIMDDPDAPAGTFVHWILWNLKVEGDRVEIKEGLPRHTSICEQGINDFGRVGYDGPCPPRGHGIHHYHIKVYALDTELNLPPKSTKNVLEKSIKGHVLSQAEIIGTFERK